MTQDEIRALADLTLAPILGPVGFVASDVEARPDHAGDESLYVRVHFAPDASVASGRTYLAAQAAMARALVDRGEDRFPYLEYAYVEAEPGDDDEQEGTWLHP